MALKARAPSTAVLAKDRSRQEKAIEEKLMQAGFLGPCRKALFFHGNAPSVITWALARWPKGLYTRSGS